LKIRAVFSSFQSLSVLEQTERRLLPYSHKLKLYFPPNSKMLAKDLKKRPLRKGNGQNPPEQPSHQEHARRGRPRQKFRTSVCLLKVFLVMQLYSSEFHCRINKMMYPGREVLALIRPLIVRPRAEWNHEDVLALARRLHCYGSVDGTGSAEDIEGAISMS
jgi:hypothetical protein